MDPSSKIINDATDDIIFGNEIIKLIEGDLRNVDKHDFNMFLAMLISSLYNQKVLYIKNIQLYVEQMHKIIESVAINPSIMTVQINNCKIESVVSHPSKLADQMNNNDEINKRKEKEEEEEGESCDFSALVPNVEVLHLNFLVCKTDWNSFLASFTLPSRKADKLSIQKLPVSFETICQKLCESMPYLTELDVSYNNLWKMSHFVFNSIGDNLKKISCNFCSLPATTLSILRTRISSLEYLDLSGNPELSVEGNKARLSAFFDAIVSSKPMKVVDLSQCGFSKTQAKMLLNKLRVDYGTLNQLHTVLIVANEKTQLKINHALTIRKGSIKAYCIVCEHELEIPYTFNLAKLENNEDNIYCTDCLKKKMETV